LLQKEPATEREKMEEKKNEAVKVKTAPAKLRREMDQSGDNIECFH